VFESPSELCLCFENKKQIIAFIINKQPITIE
jgi:hypothetical protein